MSAPTMIVRAGDAASAGFAFVHPLQADAACTIAGLSRLAGMNASGVNLVTVAPGRQAFPLHRHHAEEEWAFVVAGRATLRLDDEKHTLGPGDFVAFPPGGPAHALINASTDDDLVCLMGGNAVAADVVDFPEAGKRVTRTSKGIDVTDASAAEPFDFFARSGRPGRGSRP